MVCWCGTACSMGFFISSYRCIIRESISFIRRDRMKFKSTLLAVSDIEKSVKFYKTVLGLHVTADFGANVTLTGGLCLQTKDSWAEFINRDAGEIYCKNNACEVYFEEDDFDSFAQRIKELDLNCVHPVKEHSWGQRVVRFYDPDGHIIEVGENIETVCRRFLGSGMTVEETAKRMDVPEKFVRDCMK